MKGKIHKHPKANSNGFDKNPDNINKEGRPASIRKQLKKILSNNGSLTIPKDEVLQTHPDGSVSIQVPTQMQMALHLCEWAMSEKGNESLKALQMVIEQIDGKPKQEINQTTTNRDISEEEEKEYRAFLEHKYR